MDVSSLEQFMSPMHLSTNIVKILNLIGAAYFTDSTNVFFYYGANPNLRAIIDTIQQESKPQLRTTFAK